MTEQAPTGIIANLEQELQTQNQQATQNEIAQLRQIASFSTPTRVIKERMGLALFLFPLFIAFLCLIIYVCLFVDTSSSGSRSSNSIDPMDKIYMGLFLSCLTAGFVFLYYKLVTRLRIPIVTLEAHGIRLPLFDQLIPWQAMDECDYWESARFDFYFVKNYNPGPVVHKRFKTKYIRRKNMVLCTFFHLKGIKPMDLDDLMTRYQNACLARIRLAELGDPFPPHQSQS